MNTTKYMQQTMNGAAGNGLFTTIKYLHGAAGGHHAEILCGC